MIDMWIVNYWDQAPDLQVFASGDAGAFPRAWTVQIGDPAPLWFYSAVHAEAIKVTGATVGDLAWGQQGLDVQTPEGVVHADLGDVVRFDGAHFSVDHNI